MAINRPDIKNTVGHRFARDTAIEFQNKDPRLASPPNNVPLFAGQLIAVRTNSGECRLFVGSDDLTRWLQVVS